MSRNILLAGCGDEVQRVLGTLLSRSGFEVQSATGVSEAVGGLWSRPAMVVVDLAMGEGSGLDVVKAARAYGLDVEIAVMSSGTEAGEINWINKYRPDAIFGKPFDFDDFVGWMSEFDIRNIPIPLEAKQAA